MCGLGVALSPGPRAEPGRSGKAVSGLGVYTAYRNPILMTTQTHTLVL